MGGPARWAGGPGAGGEGKLCTRKGLGLQFIMYGLALPERRRLAACCRPAWSLLSRPRQMTQSKGLFEAQKIPRRAQVYRPKRDCSVMVPPMIPSNVLPQQSHLGPLAHKRLI